MKILDILLSDKSFLGIIKAPEMPFDTYESFYRSFLELIAKHMSGMALQEWTNTKSKIESTFTSDSKNLAITRQDLLINQISERKRGVNDNSFASWSMKMAYVLLRLLQAEIEDVINVYYSVGDELIQNDDNQIAYCCYSKGLSLSEDRWGRAHLLTARGHKSIAWIYYMEKEYEDAMQFSARALSIYMKTLGAEHIDTVQAISDHGAILYNFGCYDESLKHHRTALELRKQLLGDSHLDTAISYRNVGTAMLNDSAGFPYLLKALNIFEHSEKVNHSEILSTYQVIGDHKSLSGEYKDAIGWYSKILLSRNEGKSYNDNLLENACVGLGNCYLALNQFEESLKYYLLAFKTYKIKRQLVPETAKEIGMAMLLCYQQLGNDISDFNEWLNASLDRI